MRFFMRLLTILRATTTSFRSLLPFHSRVYCLVSTKHHVQGLLEPERAIGPKEL
jgi:hypothetical protein